MLECIEIENYRRFQFYTLDELARVNLLVGKNNSGKTALLEGIELLVSGGNLGALVSAATRRGEQGHEEPDNPQDFGTIYKQQRAEDLSALHFFFGRRIGLGSKFALQTSDGALSVVAEVVAPTDEELSMLPVPGIRFATTPDYAFEIRSSRRSATVTQRYYLKSPGNFLFGPRLGYRSANAETSEKEPAIVFCTPDSCEPLPLASMWDEILEEKRETEIVRAMQILEDEIDDLVFQTSAHSRVNRAARAGILVGFKDHPQRVPLGSCGDGMWRLLVLALGLAHAKGGYLLVDEIDTGLHYSVMANLWEMVVRTATALDIQVFATTHSFDCVRGLAVLCAQEPDLAPSVSLHKIDRNLDRNVSFHGEHITIAYENEVEVR